MDSLLLGTRNGRRLPGCCVPSAADAGGWIPSSLFLQYPGEAAPFSISILKLSSVWYLHRCVSGWLAQSQRSALPSHCLEGSIVYSPSVEISAAVLKQFQSGNILQDFRAKTLESTSRCHALTKVGSNCCGQWNCYMNVKSLRARFMISRLFRKAAVLEGWVLSHRHKATSHYELPARSVTVVTETCYFQHCVSQTFCIARV